MVDAYLSSTSHINQTKLAAAPFLQCSTLRCTLFLEALGALEHEGLLQRRRFAIYAFAGLVASSSAMKCHGAAAEPEVETWLPKPWITKDGDRRLLF